MVKNGALAEPILYHNMARSSSSSRDFVLSSLIAQKKRKQPLKSSLKKSDGSSSSKLADGSKAAKVKADDLDWHKVSTDHVEGGTFNGDEGGMLMLEEVDGVDVEWEEDEAGRKKAILKSITAPVSSNKTSQKRKRDQDVHLSMEEPETVAEDVDETVGLEEEEEEEFKGFGDEPLEEDVVVKEEPAGSEDEEPQSSNSKAHVPSPYERVQSLIAGFDTNSLPEWSQHHLHPFLIAALSEMRMLHPTPIQAQALPFGMQKGRDVVGVAETVSLMS